MSEKTVKLTLQAGTKQQESTSPSYLLNVEVLNELKHAIRQAKEAKPSTSKSKQK
jgi:hypothetical protein